METKKQHQVRLNGELVFQYDEPSHEAGMVITTIYNTLIVAGHKYTKVWKKEEQGNYMRDILEIQITQ